MPKLTILLAVLVFSGSAYAADMAVKAPPPAVTPAPTYNWTGFYIGGNAGYGWKDPTVTFTPNDPLAQLLTCGGLGCPPSTSFNIHGALGGLQAGYNWQVNQSWLLGLETDFDWSNIKGTGTSNFSIGGSGRPEDPSNLQAAEDVRWLGTVRARLGYLPADKLLLYATGGFAYGRVDENVALNSSVTGAGAGVFAFSCTAPSGAGATNCFVGNSSRTATGFAVGGGGEYILWNNLSLKAEYLYANLGHGRAVNVVAQSVGPLAGTPSSFTANYSTIAFNIVRAGLNWKF